MAPEISEVRKRLRIAVEEHRRTVTARRATIDAASAAYEQFLAAVAAAVAQMAVNVLRGEGFPFSLSTPQGSVRVGSTRSSDDYVELAFDASAPTPSVIITASRTRGRRVIRTERPLKEDTAVTDLTEEDVLGGLLSEIAPLIAR